MGILILFSMIYVKLFRRLFNLFVKSRTPLILGSGLKSQSTLVASGESHLSPRLKNDPNIWTNKSFCCCCDPKVGSCAKTLISLIGNFNYICVPRRRGQVPTPKEIPAASHHLGRRGNRLLLQGEVPQLSEGVLQAQPLPHTWWEEAAGKEDRTYSYTGKNFRLEYNFAKIYSLSFRSQIGSRIGGKEIGLLVPEGKRTSFMTLDIISLLLSSFVTENTPPPL